MTLYNGRDFICPYCENPNPGLTPETQKKSFFSLTKFLSLGRERAQTFIGPIQIICQLCGGKFIFIADNNNLDFVNTLFNRLHYSESLIPAIRQYQVNIQDIKTNFRGFVIPLIPKEIKGEIHILFKMGVRKFCLCCKKYNNLDLPNIKLIANRLEEI